MPSDSEQLLARPNSRMLSNAPMMSTVPLRFPSQCISLLELFRRDLLPGAGIRGLGAGRGSIGHGDIGEIVLRHCVKCICIWSRTSALLHIHDLTQHTNGDGKAKETKACEDVLDQVRTASSHQSSALGVVLLVVRGSGEPGNRQCLPLSVCRERSSTYNARSGRVTLMMLAGELWMAAAAAEASIDELLLAFGPDPGSQRQERWKACASGIDRALKLPFFVPPDATIFPTPHCILRQRGP